MRKVFKKYGKGTPFKEKDLEKRKTVKKRGEFSPISQKIKFPRRKEGYKEIIGIPR